MFSLDLAEEEKGLPFSVDRAAFRLATYYRSRNEHREVRRVLALYAKAKIAMAKIPAPMLGAAWLQDAYARINDFGCPEEAEPVAVALRELSKKSVDQMVHHRVTVETPKEKVDAWVNAMLAGDLPDVLARIVGEFIPDPDEIEKQVKELASKSVLSMMPVTQIDAE